MATGRPQNVSTRLLPYMRTCPSPRIAAKHHTNLLEYFARGIKQAEEEMDFSSPLSSSGDRVSKNQMMNEVRNQVAIATAQELIQVITVTCAMILHCKQCSFSAGVIF